MYSSIFATQFCIIVAVLGPYVVEAQRQPHITCPQFFRYERQGNQSVGIFTPPNKNSNRVAISAEFSLQGSFSSGSISGFESYPDKATVKKNLGQGITPSFLIRFFTGDQLPKLTEITLDGEVICSAEGYSSPYTTLTKSKSMSVSRSTSTNINTINPNRTVENTYANPIDPNVCGQEGVVPFMHGGEDLARGRYPWITAIYHDDDSDPNVAYLVYKCGGTLVTSNKVISAAHCVFNVKRSLIRVYVGRQDMTLFPEDGTVSKKISKVLTHPDYNGEVVPDCDVAILTFDSPVEFSRYIRPICIWGWRDPTGSDGGQEGVVAGWGIDEGGKTTRFPKTVKVRTVSQEQCLRDNVAGRDFITSRTLCAGNNMAHGPCLGDSGGGMIMQRGDRWLLRGIISLGSRIGDQCDLRKQVYYCDLAKHINWIQQNTS